MMTNTNQHTVNIVIPMAGNGSRFAEAGFELPKPFIDVLGKPMICHVLDNLKVPNAHYILIARKQHVDAHPEIVNQISQQYPIDWVLVDGLTEGAACTILHAHRLINNETPLLLANSDQYLDMDVAQFVNDAQTSQADGSILTFWADHEKWSYAKVDAASGWVTQVAEKVVISNNATVGVYYFAQGKTFVEAALDMIVTNTRFRNEFYTCPAYQFAIDRGSKIKTFDIPVEQMFGLGTPEDLAIFLQAPPKRVLALV
jgi:dTDP-glucose pyrophosphorylase